MRLHLLRTFVAVAEELHFGRGAARIGLTQPAASKQIADLERDLGAALFERLPRGVRLSSAGAVLLEEARRILLGATQARARVRAAADGRGGQLSVGMVDAMSGHSTLLEILKRFHAAAPGVAVRLQILSSREQAAALNRGELDVGFLFNRPQTEEAATLDGEAVSRHDVGLAVAQGSPVAARDRLRLRDLADQCFLLFPRETSPTFYDRLIAAFRAADLTPIIAHRAGQEAALLSLVAAGAGVSVVNDALAERRFAGVVLRRVEDLSIPLTQEVAWRRGETNPAVAQFRKAALDSAAR